MVYLLNISLSSAYLSDDRHGRPVTPSMKLTHLSIYLTKSNGVKNQKVFLDVFKVLKSLLGFTVFAKDSNGDTRLHESYIVVLLAWNQRTYRLCCRSGNF